MGELLNLQQNFVLMLAKLIIYAYECGYKLTLGEGYDDDGVGHAKGSTHYVRLGQDLNVFTGGVWLKSGPEMENALNKLHDKWDELGGSARIPKDLNHFSISYRGVR